MKAFSLLGLRTRKFAGWLQAFNILCGTAAVAILGFGLLHLNARRLGRALDGVVVTSAGSGRAGWQVNPAGLGARLQERDGPSLLARSLRDLEGSGAGPSTPETSSQREIALAVLDEAAAACLPGSLELEADLASDATPLGEQARLELANALGLERATPLETARARALEARGRSLGDVSLELAARAILGPSALRRRRAVERVTALHDVRGVPLLLLGLGVPAGEEATRAAAEQGLEAIAPDLQLPGVLTPEERFIAWWSRHESNRRPPPYDLAKLAESQRRALAAGPEDARAQALRGLALLRDPRDRAGALDLLQAKDPVARATAAWALGRFGGASAAEPLAEATKDPVPFVRVAAARAIGRAHLDSARNAVAALEGDRDDECRLAASLARLAFGDAGALAALDKVAFDARRSPAERLHALTALDEAGDAAAASSRWIAALSDPDATVQNAAREALRRGVHGTSPGTRAEWEVWWQDRYGASALGIPAGIGG